MISQVFIQMVKYAFGFPVVAMVSQIPVKSHIVGNDVHQQKSRVRLVHQCCILTQATSGLHPERPEHPQTNYATRLHCVLGYRIPQLPEHP